MLRRPPSLLVRSNSRSHTGTELMVHTMIAGTVGIYSGSLSLSGEELDDLVPHPDQLQTSVRRASVFYRVSPRHKVIIVKVLWIDDIHLS